MLAGVYLEAISFICNNSERAFVESHAVQTKRNIVILLVNRLKLSVYGREEVMSEEGLLLEVEIYAVILAVICEGAL